MAVSGNIDGSGGNTTINYKGDNGNSDAIVASGGGGGGSGGSSLVVSQQRQQRGQRGGGSGSSGSTVAAAAAAAWLRRRQLGCGSGSLAAAGAAWRRWQRGGMRECLFVVKNISFTIYKKSASENLRSVQFVFFSHQKGQCVVSTLTVIYI